MQKSASIVPRGLLLALALGWAFAVPVSAAPDPLKGSRRCRGAIARAGTVLVQAGSSAIDQCHRTRNVRGGSEDCNRLQGSATFSRAAAQASAAIGRACSSDDPVRGNYAGNDPTRFLVDNLRGALEESGQALQGAPSFTGDKTRVKSLRRCHAAIGQAKTTIIVAAVRAAVACQRKLDKRAQTFGALDPSCIPDTSGVAAKAAVKLGKKCSGVSGIEVGTCAQLPACVVDAAAATGQLFARGIFGSLVCGNGEQDFGEQCDDGNTSDADDCDNQCRVPQCGDGVVGGAEECDDGNDADPADGCHQCRLPFCGDGITQPGEDCDDGNTVANDGCTGCERDPLSCGTGGLEAIVSTEYSSTLDLAGIILELGYPRAVSIPGSLKADSVVARVTQLVSGAGIFDFSDNDTSPADGTDDTLRFVYAGTRAIDAGPFAAVRFDCDAGSVIRPGDFTCRVLDAADSFASVIDPADPTTPVRCRVAEVTPIGALPATTTTSTVTQTTATTTSTTVTQPTATTTTTLISTAVCGDRTVEEPETCDDGNTEDWDNCPANCIVQQCQPDLTLTWSADVHFAVPAGAPAIGGLVAEIDYPEGKIIIPGSSRVDDQIRNIPPGSFMVSNDRDYWIRIGIASPNAWTPGRFATIDFLRCQGAPLPTAADFRCRVTQAGTGLGEDVDGVTCEVKL